MSAQRISDCVVVLQEVIPVLPDMIPGDTIISLTSLSLRLNSLYVDLMVPDNNRYGSASWPVEVMGAGSSDDAQASLRTRAPYFGPSPVSMC